MCLVGQFLQGHDCMEMSYNGIGFAWICLGARRCCLLQGAIGSPSLYSMAGTSVYFLVKLVDMENSLSIKQAYGFKVRHGAEAGLF